MKILNEIPDFETLKKSVVTIGSFDGVHLGHRELLNKLQNEGMSLNQKTVVVSFFPNPKEILDKDNFKGHLTLEKEKISLIKKFKIDVLCLLRFDSKLKSVSADAFLRQVLKAFNPSLFIVGYNHCFGYKREGDLNFLKRNQKKYSFKVREILEQKDLKERKISSSAIRELISSGEIERANNILGYPYSVTGSVIKGDGLGRKIGFPTANLDVGNKSKLLPLNGVYLVKVLVKEKIFLGMCNVGFRPTVSLKRKLYIEINLFDFDGNLYGSRIKVHFLIFLRKERKFKDIKTLKRQLRLDKNKCLEYSINNV